MCNRSGHKEVDKGIKTLYGTEYKTVLYSPLKKTWKLFIPHEICY